MKGCRMKLRILFNKKKKKREAPMCLNVNPQKRGFCEFIEGMLYVTPPAWPKYDTALVFPETFLVCGTLPSHLTKYLNLSAKDKHYQIIPFENPHQKTDSLPKRSCVMMAKLVVCVSILLLLAALSKSSKYDFMI